jgi:hypothetical protein
MLHASTAASIRMTMWEKYGEKTNRYMKIMVISTHTVIATVGV